MICLLAKSYHDAYKFASTQNLSSREWFFPSSELDILKRTNFHVLVVSDYPEDKLESFERMYSVAKRQGAVGRDKPI